MLSSWLATAAFAVAADQTVSPLDQFSQAAESLVQRSSPAVLQIVAEGFGTREDDSSHTSTVSHQTGVATGVVVSADGDVITNAHVVHGARRVRVRLRNLQFVEAKVVGVDRETDLALLKVPGESWHHLPMGDSARLRQGQVVFALGSPRGLENSVSMGVISAVSRQISPDAAMAFIQTDAPINPGNSGGPLLTAHGEVIGINTFILTESGGSEGLGFAIPSNTVRDIYAQLKKYGRVRRGQLGVVIRTVTPTLAKALSLPREQGILVQDVRVGKAAAEAGLRPDDIVTRIEGRNVRNVRQFSNNLFRSEIGGKLTLEVVRGSETLTIQVPFEEAADSTTQLLDQVRDQAIPIPQLGIMAISLDEKTSKLADEPRFPAGVIVAAKLDSAAAVEEELQPGDLLYKVNGTSVANVDTLRQALSKLGDDEPVVVQVQREDALRYLIIRNN